MDPVSMPKDKELYSRIDEVVHYLWDPIGVRDVPQARDEYYSYLPEIYARVKAGRLAELLEYMRWVVVDQMGTTFNEESARSAAEVMLSWKDVIQERG
jgi:hypothetical protein